MYRARGLGTRSQIFLFGFRIFSNLFHLRCVLLADESQVETGRDEAFAPLALVPTKVTACQVSHAPESAVSTIEVSMTYVAAAHQSITVAKFERPVTSDVSL